MSSATNTPESLAAAVPDPFGTEDDERSLPPVEAWNPPDCGEIDMRIARDGTWYYQGTPIRRPALVKLFSTILRKEGERYVLVTPVERVGIKVEDAPFLAVEMAVMQEKNGEQVVWFRTNVGDKVRVDAAHPLSIEIGEAGGLKPYVLVRGGLRALVARSLVLDLVGLGTLREHDGTSWLGIESAGSFFPLAPASEVDVAEGSNALA